MTRGDLLRLAGWIGDHHDATEPAEVRFSPWLLMRS
jgi:hypothetical protein